VPYVLTGHAKGLWRSMIECQVARNPQKDWPSGMVRERERMGDRGDPAFRGDVFSLIKRGLRRGLIMKQVRL